MTNHPGRGRAETMVAIYQSGFAIFGTGKTLAQAIKNANRWLEEPITEADLGDVGTHGEMCEIEITPALAADVEKRGGDVAVCELPDSAGRMTGVYGTEDEANAAWDRVV